MKTDMPVTVYLKDYKPYPFRVVSTALDFDLREEATIVTARTRFERTDKQTHEVFLNGEALDLLSLKINGEVLQDYTVDDTSLRFASPMDEHFDLEIVTRIHPAQNTRLEGLYISGGNYCTQCEAEGFRRITYFPDRPDVLSVYTVRIEADKKFPVLLSNGNKTDEGLLDDGRHYTLWHDPFPKPCYLFALVAGDLARVEDTYKTISGRIVNLYIYVRPGDEPQCAHAMESLKKSMKWDEDVYGLEYDLDLFNIVAVSDFNMGAMENKSLNIFNTALVLAHPDTATDLDFGRVESVIAHEYFHNWSGNRVTCRDWFQLSLKEGLTVFRDQEFSADMNSRAVQRIDSVTALRRSQFPEDAGPLAHPIRPDNYIEINNFYTMTVYKKGAEVIRMLHSLLGPKKYRAGTDLYFKRHDGQAVTCEDFVRCLEEASGVDLAQFRLWYSQAGTPELRFSGHYDQAEKTYSITLAQSIPATPGQSEKSPAHIPVIIGLLDPNNGQDMNMGDGRTSALLELKTAQETYVFKNIEARPVPSVLRNFSAPVKLKTDLTPDDLAFLMAHDSDGFNRWEAAQKLYGGALHALCDALEAQAEPAASPLALKAVGLLIEEAGRPGADYALLARALTPPAVGLLEQERKHANPPQIHEARQLFLKAIKAAHRDALETLYGDLKHAGDGPFSAKPEAVAKRDLKNAILPILSSHYGMNCTSRAKMLYDSATNMTDRVAALGILTHSEKPESQEAFNHFYNKFKDFELVVDKWFSLQALSTRSDVINNIKKLSKHTDFNIKNPNRARALYGSFAMNNPAAFHAADGSGYTFLTDAIIALNSINPQMASNLLTPLRGWKGYSPDRQDKIKACLARILEQPDLAPDVYEIASKSLKS
ncbi:MAG: aminopeptidase N [Alphaproteobacteria bacterium]|nr:aminopeptidase N [Alphaproteobacteria bacterium]